MRTALDSNVLSALWSTEPSAPQILEQMKEARTDGAIIICAPVYVELCAHPVAASGFVDKFLAETDIGIDFSLDAAVWYRAAEAFSAYAQRRRKSGGKSPKRFLADFLIAAHALLCTDRLFTRDADRYHRDFPELALF